MKKEEINQKMEYLENYIELLKRSIDEAEEELQLLNTYLKFKDE